MRGANSLRSEVHLLLKVSKSLATCQKKRSKHSLPLINTTQVQREGMADLSEIELACNPKLSAEEGKHVATGVTEYTTTFNCLLS